MKLTTRKTDACCVMREQKCNRLATASRHALRSTQQSAFTLAESMAALLFLAIVIPVAVEAIYTASLAGEVAARKGSAARIADRVLNESLVMTNWSNGTQNGTVTEGTLDYRWTLTSQSWPEDSALQLVTAEVTFSAQGKDYAVKLSTLASQPGQTATLNLNK